MIIVFAAMQCEFCSLPKRLKMSRKNDCSGFTVFEGGCGDAELILVRMGVGAVAAQRAVTAVLERYSPQFVLSIGLAGAVINEFALGDLVVCEKVFYQDFQPISSDPTFAQLAFKGGKVSICSNNSLTVDQVVVTPQAKRRIAKLFSVGVIEMESYLIGKIAARHKLPFLVVRVVSDTVNERIADFNHPLKMLCTPTEWWRLGRSFLHGRKALKSLDLFLLPFLEEVAANIQ